MYWFAAVQQSSTVKWPVFFYRFQTEELTCEITGENAFNGDLFEIEDNHEQIKDEKTWF